MPNTYENSDKTDIYIRKILKKDYYSVYQESPTKEIILEDLLGKINTGETEDFMVKMKRQIRQREMMGQIVFSESIAVPHPAIPLGLETKVAIGIIPNGMEWDNNKEIKFVFLLSPALVENKDIITLTKAIVSLVDDKDRQRKMLSKLTYENFSQVLLELIE